MRNVEILGIVCTSSELLTVSLSIAIIVLLILVVTILRSLQLQEKHLQNLAAEMKGIEMHNHMLWERVSHFLRILQQDYPNQDTNG